MECEATPATVIVNVKDSKLINIDLMCRLCANQSEKLVGIYSEEGINHDLPTKLNSYLPLKITETDTLPLQCCSNCISGILAWHELVLSCIEADHKLRKLQMLSSVDVQNDEKEEEISDVTDAAGLAVFLQPPATLNNIDIKNENIHIISPTKDICDNKKKETYTVKLQESITSSINESHKLKHESIKTHLETIDKKVCPKEEKSTPVKRELILIDKNEMEESLLIDSCEEYNWSEEKEEKHEAYNFVCQYCPSMFVTEDDILKHVKDNHFDEIDLTKGDPVPILNDKRKRKNKKLDQQAVNDAKVFIDGRVYYNCKTCGKSLYSPYTYMWHTRIHTGERPYVCDLCGKQFRVSQGLVRHLRETHEGIKNFPCDLCGRMFATRRNVEEHRRIHTNERPYICDLCGKSFKQKASLFVHNRSHTDVFPYRCNYCKQGFRTRPPLLIHITRHTGEKPYPCDVCGRRFRIKYELKRHRLIHSDEKPFSCIECGQSFRQKRYLRNHNKINHNRATS